MPRWTVSSLSPINFDAFRSVFSGCRLLFNWGSSVHGHHQRSLPQRDQWTSLQPPSLQCICIFILNYCHLCYKQSYPGFVGAQRLRWGPYYQRNLTGRWVTTALKPHVNLAFMGHFFKCLALAPFFHPFSDSLSKTKMHFWVFLLFCVVPFWDVEWAKANLNRLTHINFIFHVIQPSSHNL